MPGGPITAYQAEMSKPRRPSSSSDGTSGSSVERCPLVTAMARSLPDCSIGITVAMLGKPMSIWPLMRAGSASALPLKGAWMSFSFVIDWKSSPARCEVAPTPSEA